MLTLQLATFTAQENGTIAPRDAIPRVKAFARLDFSGAEQEDGL